MSFSFPVLRARLLPTLAALGTLWIFPPVAAFIAAHAAQLPECTVHALTSWDCPLCGLVRGTLHVSQGELTAGWNLHPASYLMWLAGASVLVSSAIDFARPGGQTRRWTGWLAERAGGVVLASCGIGVVRWLV